MTTIIELNSLENKKFPLLHLPSSSFYSSLSSPFSPRSHLAETPSEFRQPTAEAGTEAEAEADSGHCVDSPALLTADIYFPKNEYIMRERPDIAMEQRSGEANSKLLRPNFVLSFQLLWKSS